jgi:deoxyadenosine/deoxycytidine kinase
MSPREPILVVLTGPIASGKSTVGRLAVAGTSLAFLAEDVDSLAEDREILARYYAAVEAFAILRRDGSTAGAPSEAELRNTVRKTQEHFISQRAALLRDRLRTGRGGLSERHPTDDIEIFSRRNLEEGLLTQAQFADLERLLDRELASLPRPSLQIFLHAEPARLRERIRHRGRPQEAELIRADNPYLEELGRLYQEWYDRYADDKVRIPTDALDMKAIADRVREEIRARGLA